MDWQKCFCILILTRCTLVTQPQQSNLHTLNGGGGGECFDKEQEFLRKLVVHLLGEERHGHWAFINKA